MTNCPICKQIARERAATRRLLKACRMLLRRTDDPNGKRAPPGGWLVAAMEQAHAAINFYEEVHK